VLQSGALQFSPTLPEIDKAAATMSMGFAQRLVCVFRERFWARPPITDRNSDFARLSFLFLRGADIPVWWTPYPNHAPVLTGWLGGANRERWLEQFASQHSDLTAALRAHALQTLSQAFAIPEEKLSQQLSGFHTYDWEHDPHSLGAYSYVNAGGLAASAAFSRPVEDTLFFAGEHTDVEHNWGTVHAAVASGTRAAEQVTKSLKAHNSA
jgi:monoamine oxidase